MDYDGLTGVDVGCENGDVGPGDEVGGALERVVCVGCAGELECNFTWGPSDSGEGRELRNENRGYGGAAVERDGRCSGG